MWDHTRLKKAIGAHGVNYLADKLLQTITEIINILQDVMIIKSFDWYETSITLEEFKEKLSLVKDKKNPV